MRFRDVSDVVREACSIFRVGLDRVDFSPSGEVKVKLCRGASLEQKDLIAARLLTELPLTMFVTFASEEKPESNICDGCGRGAAPETLTPGIVRGVAGAMCAECASRAIYPVTGAALDEAYAGINKTGGTQWAPASPTVDHHCYSCGNEPRIGDVVRLLRESAISRLEGVKLVVSDVGKNIGVSHCDGVDYFRRSSLALVARSWDSAKLDVRIADDGPVKPPPPIEKHGTLEQRYAAFRETVERVMREEAPLATWIADNIVKNREPHYAVWLSLDGIIHEALCPACTFDSGLAAFVRGMCKGLADKLAARAMGKR